MKADTAHEKRRRPHPAGEGVSAHSDAGGDEFFSREDLVPVFRQAAQRGLEQAMAELDELTRQCRWEDALALYYPVDDKLAELVQQGLDIDVRAKLAFVLGQVKRFDEAIGELAICIRHRPEDFYLHSSMAYTAYNSLYAGRSREIFLRGRIRAERIELAREHFEKANQLRPGGVTNFYRYGMLLKQIEGKTKKAIPLFEQAVANWDVLDAGQKQARRQERKNFIKALYQLAGSLLEASQAKRALDIIKRCLKKDEKTNYIAPMFKYFALGKVEYHLNEFEKAKQALEFAEALNTRQPKDFVHELLARTHLARNELSNAFAVINRVPEKARRPYYRWTEADVLCALGQLQTAKQVLVCSLERDNRSRHKALIRLARIEYLQGSYAKSMEYATEADKFFRQKWQNSCEDALFWQALNAFRLGDKEGALKKALELKARNPRYDKLDLLLERLQ